MYISEFSENEQSRDYLRGTYSVVAQTVLGGLTIYIGGCKFPSSVCVPKIMRIG